MYSIRVLDPDGGQPILCAIAKRSYSRNSGYELAKVVHLIVAMAEKMWVTPVADLHPSQVDREIQKGHTALWLEGLASRRLEPGYMAAECFAQTPRKRIVIVCDG